MREPAPELDDQEKVLALRAAASILARTIAKHLPQSPTRDIALARVASALEAAERGVAGSGHEPPAQVTPTFPGETSAHSGVSGRNAGRKVIR